MVYLCQKLIQCILILVNFQQMDINVEENQILKYDHSFNTQFSKTGERPQNFIKNVDPSIRYNKYPRLAQLMQQKNTWTKKRNHPPVYIKANLQNYELQKLGKFDVILCDPPWQEYQKRAKRTNKFNQKPEYYKSWAVQELVKLKVGQIGQNPSFIFLWAGCQHLEDARQLMKAWGYKRCEDIVWIKTNTIRKKNPPQSQEGIFVRVKQHCLMGYKGQPKKASSHNLIHPNIDIDVIVSEQPEMGSLEKPEQVYDMIERFCLGRKKIELFGTPNNIRNGWLTIGSMLSETNFHQNEYNSWFRQEGQKSHEFKGGRFVGTNATIQSLRPKQDPPAPNSSTKLSEDEGKRSLAKSDLSKN